MTRLRLFVCELHELLIKLAVLALTAQAILDLLTR